MARRGDDLSEAEIRSRLAGERRRPGARKGVRGVTYWSGGFYLSPQQFGYTTAQDPTAGMAGGEMSTATGGDAGGGGGTSA